MQIGSAAGSTGLASNYLQLLAARNGRKRTGMGQGGGMEGVGDDAGAGDVSLENLAVKATQNGFSTQNVSTANSGVNGAPANGTQPAPAVSAIDASSRFAGEDDRQSFTQGKAYQASAEYLLGMLAKSGPFQNSAAIATADSSAASGGTNVGGDTNIFNEVLKSYSDAGRAGGFNFSEMMQRKIAAAYGT